MNLADQRLALCFITKDRAAWAARLLDSLLAQQMTAKPPHVDIFVVDNDPAGSAKAVTEAARQQLPSSYLINDICYHIQPEPGIPFARNMALNLTTSTYDYIGFVDDDEICPPTWLESLLAGLVNSGAVVVHGPVHPVFETPPPDWILRGGFFTKDNHVDGQDTVSAATNNVIFHHSLVTEYKLRFNEAMRHTGGTDHLFFMHAKQHGAALIWVKDAALQEYIPASRMQERWIRQRYIRQGNTHALCARHLQPGMKTNCKLLLGGGARIMIGGIQYALTAWHGPLARLAAGRYLYRGWGMLMVLMGRVYQEYKP